RRILPGTATACAFALVVVGRRGEILVHTGAAMYGCTRSKRSTGDRRRRGGSPSLPDVGSPVSRRCWQYSLCTRRRRATQPK
ncbi:hypothetical protein EDB85DRAFT_2055744, partial [Lactarius pseudohatsudake]